MPSQKIDLSFQVNDIVKSVESFSPPTDLGRDEWRVIYVDPDYLNLQRVRDGSFLSLVPPKRVKFACHNNGAPFEKVEFGPDLSFADGYQSGLAFGLAGQFYLAGGPPDSSLATSRSVCRHLQEHDRIVAERNRVWKLGWKDGQERAKNKRKHIVDWTQPLRALARDGSIVAATVVKHGGVSINGKDYEVDDFGSLGLGKYEYVVENIPMNTNTDIDWDQPLELTDGTPVILAGPRNGRHESRGAIDLKSESGKPLSQFGNDSIAWFDKATLSAGAKRQVFVRNRNKIGITSVVKPVDGSVAATLLGKNKKFVVRFIYADGTVALAPQAKPHSNDEIKVDIKDLVLVNQVNWGGGLKRIGYLIVGQESIGLFETLEEVSQKWWATRSASRGTKALNHEFILQVTQERAKAHESFKTTSTSGPIEPLPEVVVHVNYQRVKNQAKGYVLAGVYATEQAARNPGDSVLKVTSVDGKVTEVELLP